MRIETGEFQQDGTDHTATWEKIKAVVMEQLGDVACVPTAATSRPDLTSSYWDSDFVTWLAIQHENANHKPTDSTAQSSVANPYSAAACIHP